MSLLSIPRHVLFIGTLSLVCVFSTYTDASHTREIAPTPPMGWNSWDAYGTSVTEREVRANADAIASELKDFGWQYVVIDEGWYDPNAEANTNATTPQFAMDSYGRFIPAPNRF